MKQPTKTKQKTTNKKTSFSSLHSVKALTASFLETARENDFEVVA